MTFTVERTRRIPGAVPPSRVTAPQRPMSRTEIADAIAAFKDQAKRLRPPLNDKPHQWHEDKSELVQAACALEDAVRGNRPLKPAPV